MDKASKLTGDLAARSVGYVFGDEIGKSAGHTVSEHMKSPAGSTGTLGISTLAGAIGLEKTQQWLESTKQGKYEVYFVSLMIEFFVMAAFAGPVFASGRRQRKEESERRQPLMEDEDDIAGRFTRALNRFLQSVPGTDRGDSITPEMVKIALRAYRDANNPSISGEKRKGGFIRRNVAGMAAAVGTGFSRGPVPDQVANWRALRTTLLAMQKKPRTIRNVIEIMLPGVASALDLSIQYERDRRAGKDISSEEMETLAALRDREGEMVRLGFLRFRIGVLEAKLIALSEIQNKFALVDDPEKHAALEKVISAPRNVLESRTFGKEETTPVADFWWASSVIESKHRAIDNELKNLHTEAQALEQQMIVVDVRAGDIRQIPKARVIRPPQSPYDVGKAAYDATAKDIQQACTVPNKPRVIKEKFSAISAEASRVVRDFESRNTIYTAGLTHIYNPKTKHTEFQLTVTNKVDGQEVLMSIREDDVLDPAIDVRAATDRVSQWLKAQLSVGVVDSTELSQLQKYVRDVRGVPTGSIQLSGGEPTTIGSAARAKSAQYYDAVMANRRRDLALALKTHLQDMPQDTEQDREKYRTFLTEELTTIEKNTFALQGTNIPPAREVRGVLREVLETQIPPSCTVTYDLKTHEIVLAPSGILRRLRSQRAVQRIPIKEFTKKRFEEALKEFS